MRLRLMLSALAACLASAALAASIAGAQDERPPRSDEYVYFEEMPEAVTRVPPVYPEAARVAGIWGTVVVQALVGRDGRIRDTFVTASIPALDTAALEAVRQWVFKPAMNEGKPVAVWVAIPVRFHLDGGATNSETKAVPRARPERPSEPERPEVAPRERPTPSPAPAPSPQPRQFQHPVWPPEAGGPKGPKYEHPVWPPEWSKGDSRVVPAEGTLVDSLPRLIARVEPVLPKQARPAAGMVVVRALVRSDGTVGQARVVESVPALDAAVLKAVQKWRYRAALRRGRPVPLRVYVPVRIGIGD